MITANVRIWGVVLKGKLTYRYRDGTEGTIGEGACYAVRGYWLAAEHPNHVWALDYQFDQDPRRQGVEAAQCRG